MKDLYVYHHIGMGDTILCNGLIRHFAESYGRVFLFCRNKYAPNIKYMYRDNPNIKLLPMPSDDEMKDYMRIFPNNEYKIVGHTPDYFRRLDVDKEFTFEEGFYKVSGVPFEYKWSKFYFERDLKKEEEAFQSLGLEKGSYILMHDQQETGRFLKEEYLNQDLKRIRTADLMEVNIFHFFKIMENAAEVHLHNSSFANLVDTMELPFDNLFYHRYARTDCGDQTFSDKVNWTFLD